mgnify:CR=1 FL=1
MQLRELELEEFRSFRSLRLELDRSGFRAIGANASGKSTLLEAIAMLSTTRSPQTSTERDIPHWSSGVDFGVSPYARLRGVFSREDGTHSVEIGLGYEERTGRSRKLVRLDDRPVRAVDAVGQLKSVIFTPGDVELLAGSPANRRRFLDIGIGQASRPYLKALTRYARVLEQRNGLLRVWSRERATPDRRRTSQELAFWDAELGLAGTEVIGHRVGAVRFVSDRARVHFRHLTSVDSLEVRYASHRFVIPSDLEVLSWSDPAQDARQRIAAAFERSLGATREEELRRGATAIGPHRDDFQVFADGVDLGRFGSRGQQRLAIVALKLAELELLEEAAGESPVLLLDDVLSELDSTHRGLLLEALAERSTQICLTSTDAVDLGASSLARLPLLRIVQGAVEHEDAGLQADDDLPGRSHK